MVSIGSACAAPRARDRDNRHSHCPQLTQTDTKSGTDAERMVDWGGRDSGLRWSTPQTRERLTDQGRDQRERLVREGVGMTPASASSATSVRAFGFLLKRF